MKQFEWTQAQSTGSRTIDALNQELISAINDLGKDVEQGKGASSIRKTIAFLKQYKSWHFEQEGAAAEKKGEAVSDVRQEGNAKFVEIIDKISKELEDLENPNLEAVAKEAHALLSDWVENYIMKVNEQLSKSKSV